MRSFEIKLDRAFEHLQGLITERERWLIEGQAYRVAEERDAATPEQFGYYVKWVDPEPVSESFSAILGDCLSNFRQSLDHLAYELAITHTGVLTRTQAKDSEFPIFGDRTPSARDLQRKIGCVDPGARAEIERLQPHHRGQLYVEHPLWILHSLGNIDKHRAIPVVLASVGSTKIVGLPGTQQEGLTLRGGRNIVIPTKDFIVSLFQGPIEERTRVIVHQWSEAYAHVQVNFEQTFDISFPAWDEVAAETRVIDTLTKIGAHIRTQVVDRLVKYLN